MKETEVTTEASHKCTPCVIEHTPGCYTEPHCAYHYCGKPVAAGEAKVGLPEPCPLCGCKVFKERFKKFSACTDGILGFSYRCPKCRSQFAVFGKSEAEAMERWNVRADSRPSAPAPELVALLDEVDLDVAQSMSSSSPMGLFRSHAERLSRELRARLAAPQQDQENK